MNRRVLLAALALVSCDTPARTAEQFAADPEAAARVVAACDAGRTTPDCDAARQGLVEARRAARMRAYERAF